MDDSSTRVDDVSTTTSKATVEGEDIPAALKQCATQAQNNAKAGVEAALPKHFDHCGAILLAVQTLQENNASRTNRAARLAFLKL